VILYILGCCIILYLVFFFTELVAVIQSSIFEYYYSIRFRSFFFFVWIYTLYSKIKNEWNIYIYIDDVELDFGWTNVYLTSNEEFDTKFVWEKKRSIFRIDSIRRFLKRRSKYTSVVYYICFNINICDRLILQITPVYFQISAI
jgi:hypothetical protein